MEQPYHSGKQSQGGLKIPSDVVIALISYNNILLIFFKNL
jgi:hypothetical protein